MTKFKTGDRVNCLVWGETGPVPANGTVVQVFGNGEEHLMVVKTDGTGENSVVPVATARLMTFSP